MAEYEARIAVLERKVGQLTMELDPVKKRPVASRAQQRDPVRQGPAACSVRRGRQMIELPRSTCYYRSTGMGPGLADDRPAELIGDIRDEFPGYGDHRVTCELRARGYPINPKRAAGIMREHGFGIKPCKRFTPPQNGSEDGTRFFPYPYRDLIPGLHDQARLADVTFVRIQTGFVCVAVILDACSRKAVGYTISRQGDTNLMLPA